jgi:ribosome-binding factor A
VSAPEKGRRLAERVKELVSSQIPKLKDPRVGFVTVTDVRMSRDNERATVYYTVLPDTPEQREATAQGLGSATGLLRRDLGRVLAVRHTPELEFRIDDVADSGRRIDAILADLHVDEDEAGDEDEVEAGDGDGGAGA